MNKIDNKRNLFKEAVDATPDVTGRHVAGLKALGSHSKLVKLTDNNQCNGSVDIDACTEKKYPAANRWDYVLSYKGIVYFIEIHSAETGEVKTVLRKLEWLKDWLTMHAPNIDKLKAQKHPPYYWIQTGRYNIQKNSPQYRQAIQAGIKPIPQLRLN